MNARIRPKFALALVAAACVAGPAWCAEGGRAVDRLRADLKNPDAATRREAARKLGELGPQGRPAVGDLVEVLLGDKDGGVATQAAQSLGRLGAVGELERTREGLRQHVELLGGQNERLRESVEDLERLARDAESSSAPMLSSAALFRQRIREARDLIGDNLARAGEAKVKIATIDAVLRDGKR